MTWVSESFRKTFTVAQLLCVHIYFDAFAEEMWRVTSGLYSSVGPHILTFKRFRSYLSIYFSITLFSVFTLTALTVQRLTCFSAVGVSTLIQLAAKLTSTGFKVALQWTRAEAIKDTLKTLSSAPAFVLSAQSINNTVTVLFNGLQSATMVIWDTIMRQRCFH